MVPQPGKADTGLRDKALPQGGDERRDGRGVQGRLPGADSDSFGSAVGLESCRLFLTWTDSDQETWSAPNQLLLLPPKPSCNYHTRAHQLPGRLAAKIRQKPCPCQPDEAVPPPMTCARPTANAYWGWGFRDA